MTYIVGKGIFLEKIVKAPTNKVFLFATHILQHKLMVTKLEKHQEHETVI